MEPILLILALVLLVAGLLSFGFLASVQPVWVIIDIALSKTLSGGAKTLLLLLILAGVPLCLVSIVGIVFLPLVLLLPTFYGCFFAGSSALRKTSRIALVALACSAIGMTGAALLSTAVRDRIAKLKTLEVRGQEASRRDTASSGETTPAPPAVASGIAGDLPVEKAAPEPVLPPVEPFYAVHFVSKNTEAIARFTLKGVDVQSAVPFQRPSIYPLNHIAVDPSGPVFYGITTHLFGRIDWATGAFKEVVINDPALPKLSWPAGLAFDSRRNRLFLTSRGSLYAYYPQTDYWELVSKGDPRPITYSVTEDLLFSLEEDGKTLRKMNTRGALVGEVRLSRDVPTANTWDDLKVQMIWVSEKILILSSKGGGEIYVIDPATGDVAKAK